MSKRTHLQSLKHIVFGVVLALTLVILGCGRSSTRVLTAQNTNSDAEPNTLFDTSPAVTMSLPATNVQPNAFPVSFRNLSGEPITVYYTTDGTEPDFSSDFFTFDKLLPPEGGAEPTTCNIGTTFGSICIQKDTNLKWFSIDRNNNIEPTQSVVYRVRDAKLAVELLSQSVSLNQGYDAILDNSPSPVILEYRLLFTGRMKVCIGKADTGIPVTEDPTAVAETSNLDLNTVFELFSASIGTGTPATLEDITCGSGAFADLDSLSDREGAMAPDTFPELAERSFTTSDLLKAIPMQIPMKFLHAHRNVGTYKNHIYLFYEVLGSDGTVQGLTGKEVQIVTDIFQPTIDATLASGTYGNHRYVYLYSNDSANPIHYRFGVAGDITKSDTLYLRSEPILITENTTIHFAAFDPAGNVSDTETNSYTLNLNTPTITATRFDGASYVAAPAESMGETIRYPESDLSGSRRLRLEISGNTEAVNSLYIRAGGYTIQDALISERESATTGLNTAHSAGADFDPVADCLNRACLIEFDPADTDRYVDLEIDSFTKLEYLAVSDYADLNPGLAADPDAMQQLDTHPSLLGNPIDDGTNAAFATEATGYLANDQKITEEVTINVIQAGGNYNTITDVFTGLDLRGKLLVEIKSIVSGLNSERVFMKAGDLPVNAVTLSNADVDETTKTARIDFDDLPEGIYPNDEEPLVITYKYLPAVKAEYYVYGDSSDPNTVVQSDFSSLVYEEVDQKITSVLSKSNLLNLPDKYLDPTHPDYVAIRMMDLNLDLTANPSSGLCAGQGWTVLRCALEIMKAGQWTCNDGSARNVTASQRVVPESISSGAVDPICGAGEAPLERQRISFQYLLTMTPDNANVDGTPIQGLIELTLMIIAIADALPLLETNYDNQSELFAELMNLEHDETFVDTQTVARSLKRNLIKPHPMTNDDDGSLPFLFSDALSDLTNLKSRLDFANSGVRSGSDNFLPTTGNQVARRDSTMVPDGTGYRGFLFQDLPATEILFNENTDDHNEFSLTLPAHVKGTVQGGLSLRVDTTTGESSHERLARNPLNSDHLSIFPDPGSPDSNGDGLRDCGPFSFYDGGAGCNSDNSDPDNLQTGGGNSVDQNGVGMLVDGINPDLVATLPFGVATIQDENNINMSKVRNDGYGGMHAWARGGIPTRSLNESGSLDWVFEAPHTPNNTFTQGNGSLDYLPNAFPDTDWYGNTVTQNGPQPYTETYSIEYVVHHAAWGQYHKTTQLDIDFELEIEIGWITIPIHMATITRRPDGWTSSDIPLGPLIELVSYIPLLGSIIPDDPIPDGDFFLHDTLTTAAQRRLYDMAPSSTGTDVEAKFLIPNIPLGLTPQMVKNSLLETTTGPSGQTDLKGLAADIFSLQSDAPEFYVDVFETADGIDCAGGPSSAAVTCEDEDKVLVFNTKTYAANENVRWDPALHQVGQQCASPDDNLFCGQKNWDIIADAPDAYFYQRFDGGVLSRPMDSNGTGTAKDRIVITSGGYLQIFDDGLNDYRNAESYETVEYYMELQNNLDGADRYIFRLLFTQPQTADDISFTWSRVK